MKASDFRAMTADQLGDELDKLFTKADASFARMNDDCVRTAKEAPPKIAPSPKA